jgi:hypothetical protein
MPGMLRAARSSFPRLGSTMAGLSQAAAPVLWMLSILLAGDGQSPSLREICDSYDSHVQDISTLACTYSVEHSSSSGRKVSREWERDGVRFLHVEHFMPGQPSSGLLHDGIAYFNLRIQKGRNENIEMRETLADSFEWTILPETWLGTDVLTTRKTLSELLRAPGSRLVGKEQVSGTECWRISSAPFEVGRGGGDNRVEAYFSPHHDYLPKRILLYKDGDDPAMRNASWYFDMEVVEFGRFRDERDDIDRFFPAKVRYRQAHPNEMTYEITKCAINRKFEEDHFTSRVPDGVVVLKVDERPNPK